MSCVFGTPTWNSKGLLMARSQYVFLHDGKLQSHDICTDTPGQLRRQACGSRFRAPETTTHNKNAMLTMPDTSCQRSAVARQTTGAARGAGVLGKDNSAPDTSLEGLITTPLSASEATSSSQAGVRLSMRLASTANRPTSPRCANSVLGLAEKPSATPARSFAGGTIIRWLVLSRGAGLGTGDAEEPAAPAVRGRVATNRLCVSPSLAEHADCGRGTSVTHAGRRVLWLTTAVRRWATRPRGLVQAIPRCPRHDGIVEGTAWHSHAV